jgi:hypothetical protein
MLGANAFAQVGQKDSGFIQESFNRAVTRSFVHDTFYPSPAAIAIGTASLGFGLNRVHDKRSELFATVLERRMATRFILSSFKFGARMAFREDDVLRAPLDNKTKFNRALLNIVSVERASGRRQFAWPRFIALGGMVAIESQWLPWSIHEPNPARKIGFGLSVMAAQSFYNEFAARRVNVLKAHYMQKLHR